jgi:DNA-binding IclR family transcriptional regulator
MVDRENCAMRDEPVIISDDHTVIGRALALVQAIADSGPNTTLAGLSAATGIPKPTALRIANRLVRQRLLKRTVSGYGLGPELSRLGEKASLQRRFERYLPVLEELQSTHGGAAWLTAGYELASVNPVAMVCESGLMAVSRNGWPQPGTNSMLTNTAAGHLVLSHRPDLIERVAREGITPSTPYSPNDLHQLSVTVERARQDGVAVESEQGALGFSCAAALLPTTNGTIAMIGVTMQVGQASSRELLRSALRAFDAITSDPGLSRHR